MYACVCTYTRKNQCQEHESANKTTDVQDVTVIYNAITVRVKYEYYKLKKQSKTQKLGFYTNNIGKLYNKSWYQMQKKLDVLANT